MYFLNAIIMGIVEGFTEFLPISSTAHLMLTAKVFNILQTDFVKSFEIAIQLGAILAVVWLYWKKFILEKESLKRIIVAFIPTAIIGFLLYKVFKNFLLSNLSITIWALIIGGIILIIFELFKKEKEDDIESIEKIPYWKCLIIGICQSVAIIPGVSRAAATILGGLSLKIKRKTIVEFSFLLAAPTLFGATFYDLLKSGSSFSSHEFGLLSVGFLVSFIVAIAAIKLLLRYIQKHNFIPFGIYRIIIGLLLLLLI